MKKLLFLFLLFTSFQGFSQLPCKAAESGDLRDGPQGRLDNTHAMQRIERFKNFKHSTGDNPRENPDSIKYNPCGFLDMLKKIVENPNGKTYSGLRVYFAADSANHDSLMLIFVPTTKKNIQGNREDHDDLDYCYRIIGNAAVPLSAKVASDYVRAFERKQYGTLLQNGTRKYADEYFDKEFVESKCHWYKIELLERGTSSAPNRRTGLLTYLQLLINNDSIDNVVVYFGAFEHTYPIDYYYQLTPVFGFYKSNSASKFLLGYDPPKTKVSLTFKNKIINDKEKTETKNYLLTIKGNAGYTDTGVPCPPPPSGQSCPGAFLPQP